MREIEIPLPRGASSAAVPDLVDRAGAGEGLTVLPMGGLATYPGSVHWHLKKGRRPGTLELTWWPSERRLWFKVAAGREAAWIDDAMTRLRERIGAAWFKEGE